ncbi:DUF1080 domain-containing protein [Massilia sp. TS11]|uniref:3-keto-disaccharide hydrolase n=1 Tax=Massilia sp. TS11 TaxID=2908003 RepID=UPI001EDBA8D9|nr:DUF1080 domain-containing protein [Massilia sp. TS11]MCG2583935.1 DUF1080 domain-containing protein [Massilia sp. TS11]
MHHIVAGLWMAAGLLSSWDWVSPSPSTLAEVAQERADGVIVASGKPLGFLASRASYRNYRMHVEWRWTEKPGNSGVLLHIVGGPKDGAWPLSQQVQTKFGFAGDLLSMAGASFNEPLTSAPGTTRIKARTGANSEKPAGEWNSTDIVCRDGSIEVSVNGVPQNRVTGASPDSGRVGIQFEGTPFELRRIEITPLD